ncbi:matrixin family metalloprotease [Paeniglutamicibacter psychrophenolicus]
MTTAASRWTATSSPVTIYKATASTATHFQVNTANFGNTHWSGRAPSYATCANGYYTRAIPLQLNTYYLCSYNAQRKAMVAAHELGHNLGLNHVGRESDACAVVTLMNPFDDVRTNCSVYGPKADDVRGINAKY